MHGLETPQCLIDEILTMIIRQVLCSYHSMHIRLHELLDKIDLREGFEVSRLLNVQDGYDLSGSTQIDLYSYAHTFSWLKYRNNFISRSVRKQNIEWSKGVIFLMATFCPDGLC